jgi:hypothetical protein
MVSPRARVLWFMCVQEKIDMRRQRVRTTAIGLVAAIVAAAAVTPAQAATRASQRDARAHHKKMQPWHGWGNPSYLSGSGGYHGSKAISAQPASAFGGYPGWARIAFEQGQNGGG